MGKHVTGKTYPGIFWYPIFTISSYQFVVKCAAKILKIGQQIKNLRAKLFLNREFSTEIFPEREVTIFPQKI